MSEIENGIECEGCGKLTNEVYPVDRQAFCEECIDEMHRLALAKIAQKEDKDE